MQNAIAGLHHVTAIASDAERNLDFYTGTLGLRLVKRTVNFDAPETYHFYFGDSNGTPGSLLTFFPWPNARQSVRGTGQIEATSFKISSKSIDYWLKRLEQHHAFPERMPTRFGEEVIRFFDPDGLLLELVASLLASGTSINSTPTSTGEPWVQSTVPSEHQLNGLHSVTSAVVGYEGTANLLVDSFGYQLIQEIGNRFRFLAPGSGESGTIVDLVSQPDSQRGLGGAGSVHHVAFRVSSEQAQKVWREKLIGLGYNVSPIMDRAYFRSLYFREPGGLLFELATDSPGFTTDEPLWELGTHLCLPAQYERRREKIEQMLPSLNRGKTA